MKYHECMEREQEQKALGQVIKELRQTVPSKREGAKAGDRMTREELAELVGISAPMIAKIEQGQKPPPARRLKAIAEALGVDPLELSDRGAMWAQVMSTGVATQAALRRIALTGKVSTRSMGIGNIPMVAGFAAGGVLAFQSELQARRAYEGALRQLLEERLANADVEDLERLAAVLDVEPPAEGD